MVINIQLPNEDPVWARFTQCASHCAAKDQVDALRQMQKQSSQLTFSSQVPEVARQALDQTASSPAFKGDLGDPLTFSAITVDSVRTFPDSAQLRECLQQSSSIHPYLKEKRVADVFSDTLAGVSLNVSDIHFAAHATVSMAGFPTDPSDTRNSVIHHTFTDHLTAAAILCSKGETHVLIRK